MRSYLARAHTINASEEAMDSGGGRGGVGRARCRSFGDSTAVDASVFVRAGPENEVYVRADQIDLRNLDAQLEKTRSKGWLEHQRSASPRPSAALLEWEIDLAKLEIINQIAHGTFGVVYRGTYDGHDVAGTIDPSFSPAAVSYFVPSLIRREDVAASRDCLFLSCPCSNRYAAFHLLFAVIRAILTTRIRK